MAGSVMVIDQGSHSTRALAFAADGSIQAFASVPVSTDFPRPTFVEQSPLAIVQSARQVLADVAGQLALSQRTAIGSAALIVQRSSLLACRKDNLAPLTPVISWQDTRNQACIQALQPCHVDIKAITGLRPNAHYGASKMRWLLDNDTAVQQAARDGQLLFVPLAAWLAAQLTGTSGCVVDPVIASRTLLMSLQDTAWSPYLLARFGIDAGCLPVIVPSNYAVGGLDVGGCRIPLALVGGDQSFIPFSQGWPLEPDTAYANVGTGAFVQMLRPAGDGDQRLLESPLVVTSDEKVVVLEGTVNAAATALDWLWEKTGQVMAHEEVGRALLEENHPPVFINTLAGTGSPWWLPAREPVFTRECAVSVRAVAVLESIIFALADNIACLQQANKQLCKIVIGGGLSQYDGFCQKLADLSGLPVERPPMHELSALGVAFYQMRKAHSSVEIGNAVFRPKINAPILKRYESHCAWMQKLASPAAG